jgi:hypothetical protein
MAVVHERITVTDEITELSSDFAGKDGQSLAVQNPANGIDVYVGGEGLTTTSYGFLLKAGSDISIDLQNGESIYAIVGAEASQVVNVLRQGV